MYQCEAITFSRIGSGTPAVAQTTESDHIGARSPEESHRYRARMRLRYDRGGGLSRKSWLNILLSMNLDDTA